MNESKNNTQLEIPTTNKIIYYFFGKSSRDSINEIVKYFSTLIALFLGFSIPEYIDYIIKTIPTYEIFGFTISPYLKPAAMLIFGICLIIIFFSQVFLDKEKQKEIAIFKKREIILCSFVQIAFFTIYIMILLLYFSYNLTCLFQVLQK